MSVSDDDRWLLSFYRSSEITGAMFFGRLAQYIPDAEIKADLTKHFADESQHGWLWTKALQEMGGTPLRNFGSYQDKYFDNIGAPTNIMEILAITQVFERRVINQYRRHLEAKEIHPAIKETLRVIMIDEGWHINWVNAALEKLHADYGKETVEKTIRRYADADNEIFGSFLEEHEQRMERLFGDVKRWKL